MVAVMAMSTLAQAEPFPANCMTGVGKAPKGHVCFKYTNKSMPHFVKNRARFLAGQKLGVRVDKRVEKVELVQVYPMYPIKGQTVWVLAKRK